MEIPDTVIIDRTGAKEVAGKPEASEEAEVNKNGVYTCHCIEVGLPEVCKIYALNEGSANHSLRAKPGLGPFLYDPQAKIGFDTFKWLGKLKRRIFRDK